MSSLDILSRYSTQRLWQTMPSKRCYPYWFLLLFLLLLSVGIVHGLEAKVANNHARTCHIDIARQLFIAIIATCDLISSGSYLRDTGRTTDSISSMSINNKDKLSVTPSLLSPPLSPPLFASSTQLPAANTGSLLGPAEYPTQHALQMTTTKTTTTTTTTTTNNMTTIYIYIYIFILIFTWYTCIN